MKFYRNDVIAIS